MMDLDAATSEVDEKSDGPINAASANCPVPRGQGRYIQSDPLGIAGGINLYAYAPEPTTTVDIDGLMPGCGGASGSGTKPISNGSPKEDTKVPYFTSPYAAKARKRRASEKVGGRNIATVKYEVLTTHQERLVTKLSEGFHSEKRIYDYLQKYYPNNYKVKWLYTELAPCGSDVHNCNSRVRNWWGDDFDIYYSIDYPNTHEVSSSSSDNEETSRQKRVNKAKRRRSRGPGKHLKRYQTLLQRRSKKGIDLNEPVSESDFKRPPLPNIYSPKRDSDSEDGGFRL